MAKKTLEHYMALPYRVEVYPEEDGSGYTAIIPDLPGCMTCADTLAELWAMIEEAKQLWLEVALEDGDHIPEPRPVEVHEYSGKFVTRIPRSLHRQLAQRAKAEGTSLNQLVLSLLAEGAGRWAERQRRVTLRYEDSAQEARSPHPNPPPCEQHAQERESEPPPRSVHGGD